MLTMFRPSRLKRLARRVLNLRFLHHRLRGVKDRLLTGVERSATGVESLGGVQVSCLSAAVHLLETQQRQMQALADHHGQVLRKLHALSEEVAELRRLVREQGEDMRESRRRGRALDAAA